MDAKELRIGNYLIDEFGDIRKLVSIEKNAVEFEYGIRDLYKNLKPIPLTEEWLNKLGFVDGRIRVGTVDFLQFTLPSRDAYVVRLEVGESDPSWTQIIKYVHQVQNLYFALTNKELTIQ